MLCGFRRPGANARGKTREFDSMIQGVFSSDGEENDAYIPGVNYSLKEFTGRIIAIVQSRRKMGGSA